MMCSNHSNSKWRRGFSLVELLVVAVISLVIGSAVIAALVNQTQITASQNRNVLNQENLRDSMRFMSDEILSLGSGVTEPFIFTALQNEFDFVGDVDGDGAEDRIDYTFSGSQISRALYSTPDGGASWNLVRTDVVLDGVSDLSFTYFAFGDTLPTGVDDITSVEISITLDPNRFSTAMTTGKTADQGMASRVTLRNRL